MFDTQAYSALLKKKNISNSSSYLNSISKQCPCHTAALTFTAAETGNAGLLNKHAFPGMLNLRIPMGGGDVILLTGSTDLQNIKEQ